MILLVLACVLPRCAGTEGDLIEFPAEVIQDKIQGGLLGQILGNLNGLPHEMKYIDEPGGVESYVPSLPEGACSDDDTDIEWVYMYEMAKSGELFLSPARIAGVWQRHINRNIWCANRYSRDLMDLGIVPPMTGWVALNPWSEFNISGQFVSECFGLVSPAMPATAARLGLHYTRVTIDGEPAQATQLFTAMIAQAFVEENIVKILATGLSAVDRKSKIFRIVTDVFSRWKENPDDWRNTRKEIKSKYSLFGGAMRDRNGYELNTASTIAALLYGGGSFTETLRMAFNFGWDADNNAATAGTIIGVIRGKSWMDAQGWNIGNAYRNVTRDNMPEHETLTGFGNLLIDVAEKVIRRAGGNVSEHDGKIFYRIPVESPRNMEPLPKKADRMDELKEYVIPRLDKEIAGSMRDRARAAYIAIALGESGRLRQIQPVAWGQAVELLQGYPNMLESLFNAPEPAGSVLRARAIAEGLHEIEREK